MILNSYEDKKIDINHRLDEYFPKSISTKPKNARAKVTTTGQTNSYNNFFQIYNIDNQYSF